VPGAGRRYRRPAASEPFPYVSIHDNHFSLFGLPVRFALDEQALDSAYKRVQGQVHPDRFVSATAAERRVAMQWAARANEAQQTLRSPLRRASYLCELHGISIDAESNTAMPDEFLLHQLKWREDLDEARSSGERDRFEALAGEVRALESDTIARIARAIDESRDFAAAAALVRQLMFIERFGGELEAASHSAELGAG